MEDNNEETNVLDKIYPSMPKKERQKSPNDSGFETVDVLEDDKLFPNSPGMQMARANNERIENERKAVHKQYQREMEWIKKNRPLDRANEEITTEEDQKIYKLASEGNFQALIEQTKKILMGAKDSKTELERIDYFAENLDPSDPEDQELLADYAIQVRRFAKKQIGG